MGLNRVQRGQRISAESVNEHIRATGQALHPQGVRGLNFHSGPGGVTASLARPLGGGAANVLQARAANEGASTLQLFEPVVITGQLYDGTDDAGLYSAPVLRVRRRADEDDADIPIAVVSESMQAGEVGAVYTLGVCLCYLSTTDAEVKATYDTTDGTALTPDASGNVEVLWVNPDTTKPSLVRLGGGGGSCEFPYIVDLETELVYKFGDSYHSYFEEGDIIYAKNTRRLWLQTAEGFDCLNQITSASYHFEPEEE